MFVLNVPSVAVIYFGAFRVEDGLDARSVAHRLPRSYLAQILAGGA